MAEPLKPQELPQHAVYSASGSAGWLVCAGKIAMEQGIEDTYSPYADEGSAAHFLGATCLETGKKPSNYLHKGIICWEIAGGRDGQSFVGGDPLPEGAVERSMWKVNNEMVENVEKYVNYVKKMVGKGTLLVEQRVHFGDIIGVEDQFGTSDTIILSEDGTELTIVDLKYGFKEVSAKENSQMMLYALGALNSLQQEVDYIDGEFELVDMGDLI